jgi:site-specific DNA-methyltransferase (adenine-specific)
MFSRASDDWGTPSDLFAELDREFGFQIDLAANATNSLCPCWYGPGSPFPDALATDWPVATCWLNPPYSLAREFVAKAAKAAQQGSTVVVLLPSRTDTRWWHDYVWDRQTHRPRTGVETRFLKGRLKFNGAPAGAPFPSVVVVFHG